MPPDLEGLGLPEVVRDAILDDVSHLRVKTHRFHDVLTTHNLVFRVTLSSLTFVADGNNAGLSCQTNAIIMLITLVRLWHMSSRNISQTMCFHRGVDIFCTCFATCFSVSLRTTPFHARYIVCLCDLCALFSTLYGVWCPYLMECIPLHFWKVMRICEGEK